MGINSTISPRLTQNIFTGHPSMVKFASQKHLGAVARSPMAKWRRDGLDVGFTGALSETAHTELSRYPGCVRQQFPIDPNQSAHSLAQEFHVVSEIFVVGISVTPPGSRRGGFKSVRLLGRLMPAGYHEGWRDSEAD